MANKYDCTKALDYAHELKRMCKSSKSEVCEDCPLKNYECCDSQRITGHHIDIVQNWSDEHTEKTRAEKFIELLKGTEFERIEFDIFAYDKDRNHGRKITLLRDNYSSNDSWWNDLYGEEKSCQ